MSKKISYKLEYAGVLVAAFLARLLGKRGRISFGRVLGRAAKPFLGQPVRTARDNIKNAYPEYGADKVEALVDANIAHMGRVAMEFLAAGSMPLEVMEKGMRVDNFERVEKSRALGKGVLVFGAHIGNWEYCALALSKKLMPLTSVGRRIHNPYVDALVNATRQRFGMRVIGHRDAARPMLRVLKENGVVGILLDQRARKNEWVRSTFFGRPVATNQGLALIALRSGAPVHYISSRTDGNEYVANVSEEVTPPPEDMEREERVAAFTRRFDEIIEADVRERPAEWFWMHTRWRLPKGFDK